MSPPYLPICGILLPFQANLHVPSLIFKINFSFVCLFRSRSDEGWLIFSMLDVLFSRWVFIHLSLYESKAKVLGMPSPEMQKQKRIYFMLSNNKFLGKCWYGGQPWIRLAMESESMVEKGIIFIFCWWVGYTSQNVFISKFFALSSGTSTNPYFPLWRVYLLLYAIFYFEIWVCTFSYKKHQLGGTMIVSNYWV